MSEEKINSNTREKDSLLFKRLTRLLSGPLTSYRTQTGRRLRRIDLDKFASKFTSATGKQFKKTAYDPFTNLQHNVMASQQRLERYVDFDQMEYTPEIASSVDIYADEMTLHSKLQKLLNVDCANEEIKSILESLYHNILNVDFNLFGWCRSMCKYGDFFLYLDIDEVRGVQSVIGLPTAEVERLEGEDKDNPNYVQFQWNSAGMTFENWQVAHFRILGNDKYAPYGTSILEPARRIWRQLTLLEDAMMAYRIVRSPERRVFYIDVGNVPAQDVEQYMQKVMTQMKRHQVVDPDTGRVDLRYNPLSIDEDYFIPVRGESQTKIDTVSGGQYTGDIDDVKYLRDKLFSALKIPSAYLSSDSEAGSSEDQSTLAQKDIRFARTIQRLQRSIVTELEKIGIIHLYVLGFREEDLVSFKVSLNNPSKLAELQELEHWKTKFDIAGAATEGYFSKRWVAKKIFGMSDEDFLRNQREMFYDRSFETALESVAEAQSAAAAATGAPPGMGGLGAPASLGGEMPGLGAAPMPGAEEGIPGGAGTAGMEPELAGAAPGGDEGALLAEPGKRDVEIGEGAGTSENAKGKLYRPVAFRPEAPYDKRESAGRGKRDAGWASMEKGKVPSRARFPGSDTLRQIGIGSFSESKDNYSEEENRIFTINQEVKNLITELEKRDKDETKA